MWPISSGIVNLDMKEYKTERGCVDFNSDVNNICGHLLSYCDCGESLPGRTYGKWTFYLAKLTRLLRAR